MRWKRTVKAYRFCFTSSPLISLRFIIKNTLRSCFFLSGYCTLAWYVTCLSRNAFNKELKAAFFVNGLVSGMASLLEPPRRRIELGMYCLPRALESIWKIGLKSGMWKTVKNGDVYMFCASMAVMMKLYQV